jgi:hypothetical protein
VLLDGGMRDVERSARKNNGSPRLRGEECMGETYIGIVY